jgi:N-acetylglutamate synthase-like GNAT family acetyltransferase
MTAATLRVRRATIEDLDMLRPMWEAMHLPGATLEPRLTEFQVVENPEGHIVGGIGFQIGGNQGQLHNEAFTDFGLADASRELMWKRIQTLCANHGILRLWMRESGLFWTRLGFKPATEQDLKRLPAAWNTEGPPWFTLQLKDEVAIGAVEKELAMFMTAQKRHSERTMDQLRMLKKLATIVAIVFAIIAFGAAFFLLLKRPELLHPGNR